LHNIKNYQSIIGISEKGKIPIRKILEKRDIGLYHRIETLWMEANEVQERQRSNEHHQQGHLHCEAVENNLGKIIPDDEKFRFSPLELFLLSAAACYHDAGKSDDFDEGHALVGMRDIYSHPEKYHLSDPEGKVLSYIIGSHDIDEVLMKLLKHTQLQLMRIFMSNFFRRCSDWLMFCILIIHEFRILLWEIPKKKTIRQSSENLYKDGV
jgi:hypothetical protein